jgi:hypothetical protein
MQLFLLCAGNGANNEMTTEDRRYLQMTEAFLQPVLQVYSHKQRLKYQQA